MAGSLLPQPKQLFQDANWNPLIGGQIFTYAAGTLTPKSTYQDAAQSIFNTNPTVPNARGEVVMFGDGPYRIILRDAVGNTIYDVDNVESATSSIASILSVADGAASIGFKQSGVAAVLDTVQGKLRQEICILDFIAKADRPAVLAGTSTADHTGALMQAIAEAGSKRRLVFKGIINTGLITCAIDDIDWYFEGSAAIKLIPALYGTSNHHIALTGNRPRLENAKGLGNQYAMTALQGCSGLLITGLSHTLINHKFTGYNGNGVDFYSQNIPGVARGLTIGGSFDANAGLGMQATAACYLDFHGTTFDRNGYGFQKSRVGGWDNYADTTTYIAFGFAIRLRSHHINFFGGSARDNGKDGANINQGSYAIKMVGFLAHGNNDGGITIAADNTGSGLPGEGESPFDIDLDVETYNNLTSGVAVYQPVHNLKVRGRCYNNNRGAGDRAYAASFSNGVFAPSGSTGLDIDVAAYDDRQYRSITGIAGATITAAGWNAGTMKYYPKVAIHSGTNQAFRGYATIVSEAAGSVTIAPTTNNGVALGAIIPGDYVTQAIQHCGVLVLDNCQGKIIAPGGGHHFGPEPDISGRQIISSGFGNGQNILLPQEPNSIYELMLNPGWDVDIDTNWAYSLPGGGTKSFYTGATQRRSAGSLQMNAGTQPAYASATLVPSATQALTGEFCELGFWVYAYSRADAYVQLYWFIGASAFSSIQYHPGGGFRFLKIGAQLPNGITAIDARVGVSAGKTAWFDNGSFRAKDVHMDPQEFEYPTRNLPL